MAASIFSVSASFPIACAIATRTVGSVCETAGRNPSKNARRGGLSYQGFWIAQSASTLTITARCVADFEFFNVPGSIFRPTFGTSINESRTADCVVSSSDPAASVTACTPSGSNLQELCGGDVSRLSRQKLPYGCHCLGVVESPEHAYKHLAAETFLPFCFSRAISAGSPAGSCRLRFAVKAYSH